MKVESINSYKLKNYKLNQNITPFLFFKGADSDIFQKNDEDYARRIENILDETQADYQLKKDSLSILNYFLSLNDDRADKIKTIIDFVEEGLLEPEILVGGSVQSVINEGASGDLEKLKKSGFNKERLMDIFVPFFNSVEEAREDSETGDVLRIGNRKNINIKTKEGNIKELFITPKTYMNLFTPVDRFAFVQSYTGDCYFLSVMNSIYSNPNSRERILECFNEDKNGIVEASLSGYERKDDKVIKKDKKSYSIHNVKEAFKKNQNVEYASGPSWIKIMEMLFRKEIELKAENSIDERYVKFLKYQEEMGDRPYIEKDGFRYYKDEIDLYIKFAEEYFNNPNDKEKRLISFKDMPFIILQQKDELEEDDKDEKDEYDKYADAVIKRYKDYYKDSGKDTLEIDAIFPMPLAREFSSYYDSDWNDDDPYMDGGIEKIVFNKLGMKTRCLSLQDNVKALKMLVSKRFNENYVATVSSDKNRIAYDCNFEISKSHAYSIVPFYDDFKSKFIIRNPSNFLYDNILTMDELVECFDNLTVAKIN